MNASCVNWLDCRSLYSHFLSFKNFLALYTVWTHDPWIASPVLYPFRCACCLVQWSNSITAWYTGLISDDAIFFSINCNREKFDTSFENPNKEPLELGKILGVAVSWRWPHPLNWKSTTFTWTRLEPLMSRILPVSKLESIFMF